VRFEEQIERIRGKLVLAGKKDDALKAFGAQSHRYQVRPVPVHLLEEFEDKYQIALPADFRAFLERIGAGAGPFYGIGELERGAGHLLSDPMKYLSVPSPLNPEMTESEWTKLPLISESDFDDDRYELARSKTYCGLLPFGDQGCANYSCLVVAGPATGRVVYVSDDEMPPFFVYEESFLDWYERWLDEILSGQLLEPFSGWFGGTRGGPEERLLADFELFEDEGRKLQCLIGLLVKLELSRETVEEVWRIKKNHQGRIGRKALLVLLKSDYERAESVLREELYSEDPLTLFQNLHWHGKKHIDRWSGEVKQLLSQPELEPELFRFLTYLIPHCREDLKPLLKSWMGHENYTIRTAASYAHSKEKPSLRRRTQDWFPWS